MVGVTFSYPLDTLHIHLQQPSSTPASSNSFALARRSLPTVDLLRSIVPREGLTVLYHGMVALLTSVSFQVLGIKRKMFAKKRYVEKALMKKT
ncbi:hypothetical protein ZIOFF_058655 [Zingiber officinale]|uniref:Uncharacterized protein n=1 Tax=Zingiber officinale TaxID=94328 RepID=A0A8J5KM46_ZINOF|nr:hypothetical protein ZIOFF_058655 [Zingiber officinale]